MFNKKQDPLTYKFWPQDMRSYDRTYQELLVNNSQVPYSLIYYDIACIRKLASEIQFPFYTPAKNSFQQSISYFAEWIEFLLKEYHSIKYGSEEDILGIAKKTMHQLFREYITTNGKKENQIRKQVSSWIIVTYELLLDIFRSHPVSYDPNDSPKDNISLQSCLLESVISEFVSNISKKANADITSIILYNFWQNDYSFKCAAINHQSALTADEEELISIIPNIHLFQRKMDDFYENLVKSKSFDKDMDEQGRSIQDLFANYTKRLCPIYEDSESLLYAIFIWRYATLAVIYSSRHLADIKTTNKATLSYEDNLVEKYSRCIRILTDKVNKICDDYEKKINSGELKRPWTPYLPILGIDYEQFHSALYKAHFTTLLQLDIQNAIENADFKDILENAEISGKNTGNRGCLIWFIRWTSFILGSKWYTQSAKSLFPNDKDPILTLQSYNRPENRIKEFKTTVMAHTKIVYDKPGVKYTLTELQKNESKSTHKNS